MFNSDRRRRFVLRGEPSGFKGATLENGSWEPFSGPWIQVLMATGAAFAVALIVSWSTTTFPYRLGEVPDREIRLRVGFEVPNETKYRNEVEKSVQNSRLVFRHDPKPITALRRGLEQLATAVQRQPDFDMLDTALRSDWKLTPETFAALRAMVATKEGRAGFVAKLDAILRPLGEDGILDDADLLPASLERDQKSIEVYVPGSDERRLPLRDRLLLSKLVSPKGQLTTEIKRHWPAAGQSAVVAGLVIPRLKPTLTFDPPRTAEEEDRARKLVQPVMDKFVPSDLVVPAGKPITEDQLVLLRKEHQEWNREQTWNRRAARYIGAFAVVAALFASIGAYLVMVQHRITKSRRRLLILCGVSLVTLLLARLLGAEPYHAEFLPIAVASLLMAVAYQRSIALVIMFGLSLLTSLMQPHAMSHFVALLGGTAVGVLALDNVRSRTKLISVGLLTGGAYAGLTLALGLTSSQPWSLIMEDAAWRFAAGMIAGFLTSGGLPFVEGIFGVVTDISLIELADTSHPLLQELVRRAPGTYNHSVTVSIIGEAAAKAIGGNALLVRVGALFHDIGKMLKPQYFIENRTPGEENRHDQLAPAMSTLIIIGHVKDGVDLALQHHLPRPIIELVEQHHGTTLVDYFFHEATREHDESNDPDEEVDEASFRYPGPRPQSKEAAVLMLADCVEGASRALSEPTPSRIEKLVHNLALNRLLDGQFNESGLTLKEVQTIEESLIKSLASVYHGRVKYPAAI